MWTASGKLFVLTRPTGESVCVEDIAHALARQCRFAGHVVSHYSVAQHSVLVSLLCDPADALWGLLHDALEAYVTDLPYPVKSLPGIRSPFRALEVRVQRAVCLRFGLSARMPRSVHDADKQLVYAEMSDMMPGLPNHARREFRSLRESGSRTRGLPRVDPLRVEDAELAFLSRFRELGGRW
jgi:hypothetical protein